MICIDGLSWNLLDSLCRDGTLPNLAKLTKNGASGPHKSLKQTISPRLWASIYTGKEPQKHGVEDFYTNTVKTKQIWEILHDNGEKVGVFNPLTAFDVQEVNGFFVPGPLALTTSTYPPDLEFLKSFAKEARHGKLGFSKLAGYALKLTRNGCRVSTLLKALWYYLKNHSSDLPCMYKEIELLFNADIFIHCFRKFSPTFSVFYDNGVDCVSHFYWKYMEPEFFNDVDKESIKKYNGTIKNYYRRMDKIVNRIASVAGEDATIIVVSDHGFKACPNFKGDVECTLLTDAVLKSVGLGDKAYAIRVYCGGLFRPKNGQTDLQELAEAFKKVRFKDTGEEVFTVTVLDSHVNVKINTRLLAGEDQMVIFPDSSEHSLSTIVSFITERSGDHAYNGVIIISGPKILPGEPIKDATIFDLVPTALALRKMPIPDDMDGRVLTYIFKEPMSEKDLGRIPSYDSKSPADESSLKRKLSSEQEAHIRERLKELGYL